MKQHAELLIQNADYVDEDFELINGSSIAIKDERIERIAPLEELLKAYDFDRILEGRGHVYMPGLVDSHMHTGQQLLRGRVLDEMPMIWTRIMLPFESTLTSDMMRLSAGLAALCMIRSGTTGFIDAGSYYMEEAAEVYLKSGLRGALSYSTMDQKGLPDSIAMDAEEAIRRTDSLYDSFHNRGNLKVYYSLRSLISCSRELMELASLRARERHTLLQAHMNEYPGEISFFMEREHLRPYEYLDKLGILSGDFLGAHSLLLSEHEKELLKEHDVKVCHCPFSNCGKAAPDTPSLLSQGITVALGTDGAAHGGLSLWNEMKIFRSVMNLRFGVPLSEPAIMPAKTILKMVTKGGQACLGVKDGGVIREGARADLIGIDIQKPKLSVYGRLSNTLLESVDASDVSDSIVGGRILMEKGQVLTLDEERILAEAKRYQESL
ncbi:MAG TPA: amidohydrolase family protein [Candidatus Avilachnospira avistercoris]|nr:amidohydrolase family protein [Candidatus Avilachnospira avistercoris]